MNRDSRVRIGTGATAEVANDRDRRRSRPFFRICTGVPAVEIERKSVESHRERETLRNVFSVSPRLLWLALLCVLRNPLSALPGEAERHLRHPHESALTRHLSEVRVSLRDLRGRETRTLRALDQLEDFE